jgi:PAS domain S-box-containing protein
MIQTIVLGASILFQLVAAILALRLIQITGRHIAWVCVSAALIMMAIRRAVSLAGLLSAEHTGGLALPADVATLIISILMAVGIYSIGPLFAAIQGAKDALSRSAAELEEKVADRTRELQEAERALLESHGRLEKRVEEGTIELIEANIRLQREIVERQRAEEGLAAEKEQLAVTLGSIGDGVITTDIRGRVALLNKQAEQLTGWRYEDAAGRPLDAIFNIINEKTRERCESPAARVLATGSMVALSNHTTLIAKDTTERIIADSGAPIRDKSGNIIGVVLVFRDVTYSRKLEEEIQRVERLESIGLLAGGIAHDFNNILTAILGNIRLATMFVKSGDKVASALDKAEKASLRAKDLTQQLLTFSKGRTPVKKITSISELVSECASFALRGSNVQCHFSLPADLWLVEVDDGQIGQVIENLIINADQAMPEGGSIRVSAENVIIETDEDLAITLTPGQYVKLSVSDTGCGISKGDLTKIFDPYFSTKPTGSGLGLASAYSIIRNHEGSITVQSELNCGTAFHIYLPASIEGSLARKEPQREPAVGVGRVLVMDDEQDIRELAKELLTLLGYDVECAANGSEAIELFRKANKRGLGFHAVIMDLTIPGGLGGKATIRKLLEIDPGVKAIMSSGYSNDQIMSNYRDHGFKAVVPKPYDMNQLSQALRHVIAGEEA